MDEQRLTGGLRAADEPRQYPTSTVVVVIITVVSTYLYTSLRILPYGYRVNYGSIRLLRRCTGTVVVLNCL